MTVDDGDGRIVDAPLLYECRGELTGNRVLTKHAGIDVQRRCRTSRLKHDQSLVRDSHQRPLRRRKAEATTLTRN
jgi:hypothetical protein